MSRRKAVWSPSDIRDWGGPRAKPVRDTSKPAPEPLPADTEIQVRIGRDEWRTKLEWVVDLLSANEIAAVYAALAERRPIQLVQRPNRAAFVISVPEETVAADGA
jgi:hypothetical protein